MSCESHTCNTRTPAQSTHVTLTTHETTALAQTPCPQSFSGARAERIDPFIALSYGNHHDGIATSDIP